MGGGARLDQGCPTGVCRRSRATVPRALAAGVPGCPARHRGRRRRGRHRPGGVSRRRPQPRSLRPPPPVCTVAASHRRQPRDRLDARPAAARRGRARRVGPGSPGGRAGRRDARAHCRAAAGASRGGRSALRARVHARGDRRAARPAARHRQLAAPPRPRPDEGRKRMTEAEDRVWEVVRRAYEERTPAPAPRRVNARLAVAALVIAAGAVVAAALSPPGHAVFERVRKAVGVEHAAPALFSLPGGGRLLVRSGDQVSIVEPDGAKRALGTYTDAAWSPHGLYIAATKANELVALDPEGNVRWTLARRDPSSPTWSGTRTDTRIAYDSNGALRVVAGDGTGDRLLDRYGGGDPPAWDPARHFTLAYYSGGAILLREVTGKILWRRAISVLPTSLAWSSDGRYLAVFSATRIVVLDGSGHVRRTISMLGATLLTGAFAPGTHR